MKIAATVILFVAALFVADGVYSGTSIGETIKPDFLNLEAPSQQAQPTVSDDADEEVMDGYIETIRRRRTRRQSRFC